jgi:UDP-galactopyranose mutase
VTPRALVVGAGITGCTVAHWLAARGVGSVVLERSGAPGGLIRCERLDGVLYEQHGTHVFHTDDDEVWRLATDLVPFNGYRHRVRILIEGRLLNWPIVVSDLDRQSGGERIRAELAARRHVDPELRARAVNFEEWCLDLMGPTLYERYVRPYTQKQWGRPPRELPATWAPRRVAVRWDDDPYLFRDRHQGWPGGPNGYNDLIDALLDDPAIELRTGVAAGLESMEPHMRRAGANVAIFTCALDELCECRLGALDWRGVAVRAVHVPGVEYAQTATVVNYPAAEYPFIRIHETKHASGQSCRGTVLGFEFTGHDARHYPVETPSTKSLNDRYMDVVRRRMGADRAFFAGRLATYSYLDMDRCMRQAIDCAEEVVTVLQRRGAPV